MTHGISHGFSSSRRARMLPTLARRADDRHHALDHPVQRDRLYGSGLWPGRGGDRGCAGHTPSGQRGRVRLGRSGGIAFFVDPKEDMAVVFMTQVLGAPERIRLRRELRTLVYGAMTESFAKGPGA